MQRGVVVALPRDGVPDPSAQLGGIALVTRAVMTLRRGGCDEVVLVGAPEVAEVVRRERRLALTRFDTLADAAAARMLVLRHDAIVAPGIVRAMACREAPGTATVGGRRAGVSVVDAASAGAWEAGLPEVAVTGWHADAGDREAAMRHLLEDCRKAADGFVSRHLNRHLSLAITARLIERRAISPNAVTGVVLAVSLAGAALAARGGYGPTLAGATLMQLGSILDGVDGEIARIRFEESALGAWLDTIVDDLGNVAFWAALAQGAPCRPLRYSGRVAAGANALAALVNYAVLASERSGDLAALLAQDERHGVARVVALALRQDAFLAICLVLAAAGRLHHALPAVAAGALVTLGASLRRALSARGSNQR